MSGDAVGLLLAEASAAEREGRVGDAAAILAALGAVVEERLDGLLVAGVVAARQGGLEKAARLLARAAKLGERKGGDRALLALVQRNRIEILRRLQRPREAVAAGRAAIALAPDDPVVLNNLALAHFAALELDAALACYDRAIALDPGNAGAQFGRGEVKLAIGDYSEGWKGYAWRFRLPGVPAPLPAEVLGRRRQWKGRALAGTLLLVADQGFGDVVQFARYIPWAAARCGRLVVAASPEMRPVIAQFPEVAAQVAEWAALESFQAWAALSDLPGLAGTRAESIPAGMVPYLAALHEDRLRWRARLDELTPRGKRLVGLVWAGRASHPQDFARSASLAGLAPMGDVAGVCWVALQVGGAEAALGGSFWRAPVVNLGPEIAGFADTMAILAELDLVVTVDTSVAHLAGAMGRACWLMLPRPADWRWGLNGTETPWYPSLRLFRQQRAGDWNGVARAVAAALSAG
jgi:hypothetical protein